MAMSVPGAIAVSKRLSAPAVRVAIDAGIVDDDVVALLAQGRLQLRRIGSCARHQITGGSAVAEGDDVDGAARRGDVAAINNASAAITLSI